MLRLIHKILLAESFTKVVLGSYFVNCRSGMLQNKLQHQQKWGKSISIVSCQPRQMFGNTTISTSEMKGGSKGKNGNTERKKLTSRAVTSIDQNHKGGATLRSNRKRKPIVPKTHE
jgi:hypothetical protein